MPFSKSAGSVPFSKFTVFKICRQKMCRFRVNGRPIRHIFHRSQNVPASCERSLSYNACSDKKDCVHEPVLIEEATGDDASLANFVSPAKIEILMIQYCSFTGFIAINVNDNASHN